MKERSIIFSSEMVIKSLLEDRKIQMEKIIKPQPSKDMKYILIDDDSGSAIIDDIVIWQNKPIGNCAIKITKVKCPYQIGDRLWVKETWALFNDGDIYYKADNVITHLGTGQIIKWKSPIYMPRWASRITLEIVNVQVERLNESRDKNPWAWVIEFKKIS